MAREAREKMVRSAEARSIARATTTRTRRVSAAVTPSEGVSSEAARGTPRRARREVGERRRGRRARGAGEGAEAGGPAAARVRTPGARSRRGATRTPPRVAAARRARGTREGRAIDAAIESIGAARATVAIDAAIGAPRRRKDGRARGEVWQPGLPWDGTSRVRGISTRLSSAREAHQKAARGAASFAARFPERSPAQQRSPKTARIQHRGLDDVRTPGRGRHFSGRVRGVIDALRRSRTPRAARSAAREPEISASTRLSAGSKSPST